MKKTFMVIVSIMMLQACAGCANQEVPQTAVSQTLGTSGQETETFLKTELPSSYCLSEDQEMPQVRNQEGSNTCWVYASLSALESSKDEDVKSTYSAEHLLKYNTFRKAFEEGGSYVVSMAYLLSWKGPVAIEKEPLEAREEQSAPAEIHVQEMRWIQPKDYASIKRYVYHYGGVESALFLDFEGGMSESRCYNEKTKAYCYSEEMPANHEVVIVGWDDNYPAENFTGDVSSDGAFLCLNSWGESFGEQGLFYVSYEDVNIGSYGIVYSRIDPSDNYDKIYQSDLCGYTAQVGYAQEACWFANVYKAEENIQVKAAGFYATEKETTYEIYAVNDFQDQSSLGQRKFICKGFLQDGGYYTIDFPEALQIDAGKAFALVVKIHTKDVRYPVAVEGSIEGFLENTDLSDGEGYLSYQGTTWERIEDTKKSNICLKAYADLQ